MKKWIEELKLNKDVTVKEKSGFPVLKSVHTLPEDLKEFYSLCGGLILSAKKRTDIFISEPTEFILSNDDFFDKEVLEDEKKYNPDFLSWECHNWYNIADIGDGHRIVIDLGEERYGKCYLGDWQYYPVLEDMPLVANNFTEFLTKCLTHKGKEFYWYEH